MGVQALSDSGEYGHLFGDVPGLLQIYTYKNTDDLEDIKYDPMGGAASTSIQDYGPEIQHDGQIVAMTVADTFEAAREAAYKLKISYSEDKPSAGFGSEGTTTAKVKQPTPKGGDAEADLGKSAVTIDGGWTAT